MNRKGKVPMLDVDGFRRYLKPMLNSQQPFLAWWHPSGFGCVMTGPIEQKIGVTYLSRRDGKGRTRKYYSDAGVDRALAEAKAKGIELVETSGSEKKLVKFPPGQLDRYRKMIEKLERTTWPVYTVEFDGAQTITTGGFEL